MLDQGPTTQVREEPSLNKDLTEYVKLGSYKLGKTPRLRGIHFPAGFKMQLVYHGETNDLQLFLTKSSHEVSFNLLFEVSFQLFK